MLDSLDAHSTKSRRVVWVVFCAAALTLPIVLAGPRGRVLLLNTFDLCAGTMAIALPLGIVMAFLIARTDLPGRKLLRAGLVAWLFIPLYVQAGAWRAAAGALGWIGHAGATSWLSGARGAIWVHGLAQVPWTALVVSAGLSAIPAPLEEAAMLDASLAYGLRRVTLRLVAPFILLAAAWSALSTAGEITVTSLFMFSTYADELYSALSATSDVTLATLEALPGILVLTELGALAAWCGLRLAAFDFQPNPRRPREITLGRARWPLAVAVAAVAIAVIGVPLAALAVQTDPQWREGWSPVRSLETLTRIPGLFSREIGWSLLIGVPAALAALAIAAVATWSPRGTDRGRGAILLCIAALSWTVPGPLIALGLSMLFSATDAPLAGWLYDQTIFAPWLVQTWRALPVAMWMTWHARRSVPPQLCEAAALDGLTHWQTWRRIFLPLRWRSLLAAGVAGLAVAWSELGATHLVAPPGVNTLSMRIFDRLHTGSDVQVSGVCLLVSIALAGAAWLCQMLFKADAEAKL